MNTDQLRMQILEIMTSAIDGSGSEATATEEVMKLVEQAVAPYREDAERWQYFRSRVSAATRKTFHFEGIVRPLPAADLWRGSVAQHLDASIDAARRSR